MQEIQALLRLPCAYFLATSFPVLAAPSSLFSSVGRGAPEWLMPPINSGFTNFLKRIFPSAKTVIFAFPFVCILVTIARRFPSASASLSLW